MQNKDLKQLAEAAKQGGVENARIFKELEEKRQKIDKRKQARIYHSGEAILEPSWKFIKPAPTFLARRISLIEPAKIIEAANRLEDAAAGRELGNEFIRKLRVIEKNVTSGDVLETDSRIKVRKKYLGCLISDLDEDAGSILISKELASQIERIYGAVKNYEMREIQNQFSRYEDVVEKGSIAKLTEGRFYDISAYSKDRKDPQGFLISAFSKRRGGIGFLRWAQDKGWYAEGMARGRLMDLIGQLKARQTNVKLRIERVY